MTPAEWEAANSKSGFALLEPRSTRHGRILIAERYYPTGHPEFHGPHWQMQWMIDRDGPDTGRRLFFASPSLADPTRLARVNAALKDAKQFIKDSLEVGRYTD